MDTDTDKRRQFTREYVEARGGLEVLTEEETTALVEMAKEDEKESGDEEEGTD